MREAFVDDIAALATLFAALMDAALVKLRLEAVTSNACSKFHVDAMIARLICTYRGTGTQYGMATGGDVPRRVLTVPTGSPIVLRGTLWPPSPSAGVLHRSPPIEGTGETRLVLVVDPDDDSERRREPGHDERSSTPIPARQGHRYRCGGPPPTTKTKRRVAMKTRAAIAWAPNQPLGNRRDRSRRTQGWRGSRPDRDDEPLPHRCLHPLGRRSGGAFPLRPRSRGLRRGRRGRQGRHLCRPGRPRDPALRSRRIPTVLTSSRARPILPRRSARHRARG